MIRLSACDQSITAPMPHLLLRADTQLAGNMTSTRCQLWRKFSRVSDRGYACPTFELRKTLLLAHLRLVQLGLLSIRDRKMRTSIGWKIESGIFRGIGGWVGIGVTVCGKPSAKDHYVTNIAVVCCSDHHTSLSKLVNAASPQLLPETQRPRVEHMIYPIASHDANHYATILYYTCHTLLRITQNVYESKTSAHITLREKPQVNKWKLKTLKLLPLPLPVSAESTSTGCVLRLVVWRHLIVVIGER